MNSDPESIPIPRITTVLTPDERLRVDAAGQGIYRAWHRDNINDALRDLCVTDARRQWLFPSPAANPTTSPEWRE